MSDITDNPFDESKQKKIELIKFDKELNLQYHGICDLVINQVTRYLIVKPGKDNEFKKVKASFKQKFVADKNILFVFGKHKHKSFVLVFNDEDRCKIVFDLINSKNEQDEQRLKKRFLTQILGKIGQNSNQRISEIFAKWLSNDNGNPKKEYVRLMKGKNVYDLFFPQKKNGTKGTRKRKHHEMNKKVIKEERNVSGDSETSDNEVSDNDDDAR